MTQQPIMITREALQEILEVPEGMVIKWGVYEPNREVFFFSYDYDDEFYGIPHSSGEFIFRADVPRCECGAVASWKRDVTEVTEAVGLRIYTKQEYGDWYCGKCNAPAASAKALNA